jgi:hypothetical protein
MWGLSKGSDVAKLEFTQLRERVAPAQALWSAIRFFNTTHVEVRLIEEE